MSGRDPWVHGRLAELDPPPRRRGFEEELWQRVEAEQRASARRWRLTSVVLAAAAVAAATAAAVLATSRGGGSTIDRTFSCRTQVQAGAHVFQLEAWPRDPQLPAAGVQISTRTLLLLAFNTFGHQPLAVETRSCRAVTRPVPLAAAGLPPLSSFPVGYVHFTARCLLPGRLLVRVRLRVDGSGRPQRATLALRLDRRSLPVAYIRWSPQRVTAAVTRRCG